MPSRREWTDSNLHDPGITVVELLVYALSDLTYAVRDRVGRKPCGWPCALAVVAATAAVAFLVAGQRRHR